MGRRQRSKAIPKRLAKMVTAGTAGRIDELATMLREERSMESRLSDNDTIKAAVEEAIAMRRTMKHDHKQG